MSDVLPRAGVFSALIPDRCGVVAVLVELILTVTSAAAQKPKPVAIFVGADTRGGASMPIRACSIRSRTYGTP